MTEPDYDPDGLDGSWDGDLTDLPDLTGLDVSHFEAAEGEAPPPGQASRAMPKPGTGARFARLKSSLAAKGARDPGALAAYIGRKKFGKAKFRKLASAARGKGAKRMETLQQPASAARAEPVFFRTYELEDIQIITRAQGDPTGRLVEAYAAVFNQAAEIHDHEGHYEEENDPAVFNRSIDHAMRASRCPIRCIYNHGMTIHGTPAERFSIPIGTPKEFRAESRGLLTRTLYNETPLADEVLEAIRSGGITAQSYTGRIIRSSPELRPGERRRPRNGQLPRVRRLELGLREYGPTPFPAFSGAEILGVRMSTPGSWSPDPDETEDEALPPDEEPAAGDPLPEEEQHSARYHQHALYALRSREQREKAGLVW